MSSPLAFQEIYKSGFDDFAIPVYETAPFTQIQNRAKVTRSLKAIAGVERIHVRGINLLQNEFGPAGEQVFEADNKDSRIRFVGGWSNTSGTSGPLAQTVGSVVGDFVEITYYGTGLNLIALSDTSTGDYRVTIDGGVEGSNIYVTTSAIINARNYSPNAIMPIVNNQTLGWHTVKIRHGASTSNGLYIYGFEILNERTNLAVYQGTGISQGGVQGLSVLTTSAFNAGVSGTRGARVVKYVQNGVLSQAVQEVDATSKFLTLADHTNEEVVRRINFREFGANRADDISTANATQANRAFTLDDGTTALAGQNVQTGSISAGLNVNASGDFMILTFVGTGLDISITTDATTRVFDSVSIDGGASIGSMSKTGSTPEEYRKICSGLPYGTHTVRFQKSSAAASFGITDFIIYQPKKPSIPAGAIEVADYNLVASYSNPANTDVGGVPQGVIRKNNTREFTFVGTWAIGAVNALSPSGFSTTTTTAASYVEYRFWGTGFNYRFGNNAGAQSQTVSVDGSTNLSSLTTALAATAGLSFTAATGVITGSPAGSISENNLSVTGLTLGWHTVRVTWTSGVVLSPEVFDIVTPIHINQPSLKTGSLSLKSLTKYSPEKNVSNTGPDLSKAKAWVYFDMVNQVIFKSWNVSSLLRTATGQVQIFFEKPFKDDKYIGLSATSDTSSQVTLRYQGRALVDTRNSSGVLTNASYVGVVFFGELIEE